MSGKSAKNIVICSDGTGQRGGPGRMTNVWRTFLAVNPAPQNGPRQVRFHDDGVGSQANTILRVIGGACGYGISRSLRYLYSSLITTYNPGDRIYLFGFSRGAYTVRVLAQMISLFGVPDREGKTPRQIAEIALIVLDSYKQANKEAAAGRDDVQPAASESKTARALRQRYCRAETLAAWEQDGQFLVHFIGCWDTVGALGLPIDSMTRAADQWFRLRFRSLRLNRNIHHARHALALDDERHTFHPVLWDEQHVVPGQTIKQVWFPGVHSNVGGSYPKDQLAHVPLLWMFREAADKGLIFHDNLLDQYRQDASVHGKMYDSRAGLASYYRYRPREVEKLCGKLAPVRIHAGTLQRIQDFTEGYAPLAITQDSFYVETTPELPDNGLRPDPALIGQAHSYVLLNRAAYFMFIAWSVAFLAIGWWFDVHASPFRSGAWLFDLRRWLGTLEIPALDGLIAIVPAGVGRILQGYQKCPGPFSLMLLLLAVGYFMTRRLFDLTREAANRAWAQARAKIASESAPGSWHPDKAQKKPRVLTRAYLALCHAAESVLRLIAKPITQLRSATWATAVAGFWHEKVIPIVGWALLGTAGIVGVLLVARLLWFRGHDHELVPASMPAADPLAVGEQRRIIGFETQIPYFPTDVELIEGAKYELAVEKFSGWLDNSLDAGPDGLMQQSRNPLARWIQWWARRDGDAPIFHMMAAIGPGATTRIPIGNAGTFRASRSGRLYLFVNDVPGFYGNNQGTAELRIKRLPNDAEVAPGVKL